MKYITYKFYDKYSRRLAIFYDKGVVTVIPCSKNDQFSKSKAKELYNTVGNYKQIFKADLPLHKDFMKWCFANYRIIRTNYIIFPSNGELIKAFVEKHKIGKELKITYLS